MYACTYVCIYVCIVPKHHSEEFPVLSREHVISFDIETMTTLMEMCGEAYHKVHKKWKSGLSMVKHLQQDIVKSEQDPQGTEQPGSETVAEPVGIETREGHDDRATKLDPVGVTADERHEERNPEVEIETKTVPKNNKTLEETLRQEHDKGQDLQVEFLATEGKNLLKDIQILVDVSSARVTGLWTFETSSRSLASSNISLSKGSNSKQHI